MAIAQSFIDTLKTSCDIETVISGYLPLKRQGRNLVGLCPFHSEKTPSMVVYTDTQSFHCFGCGTGGDVITFVMKMENLGYIEALKFLAERNGIPFPEEGRNDPSLDLKPLIYEINRTAARYYHEMLKSEAGKKGLDYLTDRGLTSKTIVKYGLGFAPEGWSNLKNYLRKKGFTEEQMLKAAVLTRGKNQNSYDLFRNRIIFPIIDLRKNVIGFGGRVLDDSKPKYLNSPDTPVFKKSRNLFSLNFAKIAASQRLILAEGYMDVISIHQAGFENAVATLGTALTPEQCRLISQYTKEVVIAYDSDGAGRNATDRAMALLKDVGVETKILSIPDAKDPDEYIKKFGAKRFSLLIEGSDNVIDYRLSLFRKKYDLSTADGLAGYLNESVEYLSKVESPIEREVYAGYLAKETGILKETVLSNIHVHRRRNQKRNQKESWKKIQNDRAAFRDRLNPKRGANLTAALAEEGIIAFLFQHSDYLTYVLSKINKSSFITELNRELFCILTEKLQNNNSVTLIDFSGDLPPEKLSRFSEIIAVNNEIPKTKQVLDDYIRTLLGQQYKNISQRVGELSDQELYDAIEQIKKEKK